jgi:hypothetical protein
MNCDRHVGGKLSFLNATKHQKHFPVAPSQWLAADGRHHVGFSKSQITAAAVAPEFHG